MGIHCCDVTILGKESFAIGVELKGCDLIATFVGALFRFFAFSLFRFCFCCAVVPVLLCLDSPLAICPSQLDLR